MLHPRRRFSAAALLLVATLAPAQSPEIERQMRALGVDRFALDSHSVLHVTQWVRLTAFEKENLAKGVIVSREMGTADDPRMFRVHSRAAMQCMDSGSHRVNDRAPGATVGAALGECAARTYKRICPTCPG